MDCKVTENFLHELVRSGATLAHRMNKEEIDSKIRQIQEWSDEHPQRTYLSDFLEKHPNALLNQHKWPPICAGDLGYRDKRCGGIKCADCWNTPMEDKP